MIVTEWQDGVSELTNPNPIRLIKNGVRKAQRMRINTNRMGMVGGVLFALINIPLRLEILSFHRDQRQAT